ncbi:S-adenosylmethionine synthetase [Candidatus Desulfofervidus auxilii]|uniref:S-adenosylmethionine synthase n=1 Tax=Desulfofervidus auxilii TaxID=1621989 RepID=A0A7U4QM30_DESA2|nr:methionine adenosyltransferase [Candidatus Desulfofervidus auxilii]AMM41852.1 S-adenosylmethionine synthetase [Candidatus Desulfofervidus auxilii]
MKKGDFLFTSESVTEGHPDKIADQISDAILDAILTHDKKARVACETLVTTGLVFISGEITTSCYVEIPEVVRETIKEIGYNSSEMGFDWETCGIITSIDRQSPDIAIGVNRTEKLEEIGAGDQGIMFGYACTETDVLMPTPIHYAHRLAKRLAEVRKTKILDFLRPDGKTQVTVRYVDKQPREVTAIVVAAQHEPWVKYEALKEGIIEEVIHYVIPENMRAKDIKYFINTTGRFVVGGPLADTGTTGRKIIVDTYGGMSRHGGGCYSGKDPSKVDRSGGYMARYVAKNIVASGLAERCEIQIAYTIGRPEPVSVMVNTFGTGAVPDREIERLVGRVFDLRPGMIIKHLQLLRPIYKQTAAYGHFGRRNPDFTWENTDMKESLRKEVGK